MTSVAIVGGGLGGLAAALFAARRGHDVVVLERDEPPAPSPPDDDHRGPWYRRGVPQAAHSHTFLGRAVLVLRSEAPDVLAVLDGHAHWLDFTERFAGGVLAPAEGDDDLRALGCRRRTLERALLAAVLDEPGVTIQWGQQVASLVAPPATPRPHVAGVRTTAGLEVRADLVVDASGARTSATRWLARDLGIEPPATGGDSGFTYFTRWYRLRDGMRFPTQRRLPYADGQFATVATFPADDGTFSLTYMAPSIEPRRAALRDTDTFEQVLGRFTLTAAWLQPDLAVPTSDVREMPGGQERSIDLAPDGRSLVSGFVCLADAAMSTNPTRGRGTTMAFLHARLLADLLPQAHDDPAAFADTFAEATAREILPWFESTVAFDRSRLRRLQAGVHEPFPAGVDAFERAVCAFSAYAEEDEVLYRALVRILNMLAPSDVVMAAPDVREHLATTASRVTETARFDGPTRREFEALCA